MQGLKDVKTWKKSTGTQRKISPRLSRKLGHLINQNPMVTREELPEDLHSSECTVTKRTISNEMLRNGLKSRGPKKTPLLLKRHWDARLKSVRLHKEKENSFWERILWTNETKIELFGHNYRNHLYGFFYKPRKARFIPTFCKRINRTSTAVEIWVTAFEERKTNDF